MALLNALTEILKLPDRPDLRRRLAAATDDPGGCTGIVVSEQVDV